jgi:hypothetical protein
MSLDHIQIYTQLHPFNATQFETQLHPIGCRISSHSWDLDCGAGQVAGDTCATNLF